jgi:hypothetical protein
MALMTLAAILDQAKALSVQERKELLKLLIDTLDVGESMTAESKIHLLDAAKLHNPVREAPSVRRADWYDDDGR